MIERLCCDAGVADKPISLTEGQDINCDDSLVMFVMVFHMWSPKKGCKSPEKDWFGSPASTPDSIVGMWSPKKGWLVLKRTGLR